MPSFFGGRSSDHWDFVEEEVVFGEEEVGVDLAEAFAIDRASGFAFVVGAEGGAGGFGDVDATGEAGAFHAAGDIHGVAPDVVGDLLFSDDVGDEKTSVPHIHTSKDDAAVRN